MLLEVFICRVVCLWRKSFIYWRLLPADMDRLDARVFRGRDFFDVAEQTCIHILKY